MIRYLNIKTLRQTTEFINDTTTIEDSDDRVINWFSPVPDGFKGEWVGDTYTFIEIPTSAALTPEEIDAQKDAQVEAELGSDNIRILTETFIEIVNDGTIATDTVDDVIAKAKTKRKAEL